MSNSQVTTSVSGNNVTITVKIDPSDILFGWWVRIISKYDYGYGKGQGVGDYRWIVEIIDGGFSTYYNQTKTYKSGLYAAELNLMHVGPVDFSTFELGTITPPPVTTPVLTSITIPSSTTVEIGNTTILTATCKDKNGNVMTCPTLKWGSGTSNVTVDNNGVVTAISLGTALVNCWDADTGQVVSNICSITIKTPVCTNPKYKCSGTVCISDNCDGTGTFTTPDCNNTCTCPDQGSKCDIGGNQCYYNVKTCTFDCQPCPSGSECQMQGGLAKCIVIVPPITPPGCTNPKYKLVGGICASDDCDGTGTYTDSACTSGGGGGGTTAGILTSITIDKTASVQVGKTVTLTAICKDVNANTGTCPGLVWQSDNESIATVSAGVVTGVGIGTANILVKDSATSQIISNIAIVTVGTGVSLTDWFQQDTCIDSQKKYCTKNWVFGVVGITVFILLTRKKQ